MTKPQKGSIVEAINEIIGEVAEDISKIKTRNCPCGTEGLIFVTENILCSKCGLIFNREKLEEYEK